MSKYKIKPHSFKFSEGVDRFGIGNIEIIRTGMFKHPDAPGGFFAITKEILQSFIDNFDNNVREQEILMDFGHHTEGKSAGEIQALELMPSEDAEGQVVLVGSIDWTKNAEQQIIEKEWRYISADIDLDYMNNESDIKHGPVLLGAALVNRPHIKKMRTIFAEQETITNSNGGFKVTLEDAMKKIGELEGVIGNLRKDKDVVEDKLENSEHALGEVKTSLKNTETELDSTKTKLSTMEKEVDDTKKEAKFSELLGLGKIVPAQKEDFMKMELSLSESFFKNASIKLNLNDGGHGQGKKEGSEETEDAADQLTEIANKIVTEKKISFVAALSEARTANPKLAKQLED